MARSRNFPINLGIAACAVALMAIVAGSALAQTTTGAFSGRVLAQTDQSALPGVMVEAIHVPTGTRYAAVSQNNGRFGMQNLRVGGPYTVTATIPGFRTQKIEGLSVALGETRDVSFELVLETVTESVEVTAEAIPLIAADKMGSGSGVTLDQLKALPTVRRQLQDFARLNPYFVVDAADQNSTRIAVAGKNNRYNSVQIDGAVNNDLFGLADTGTPGGQTDTQPIALDSVQELQLVVSPYDIKQGGFTGGAINVITKSGGNQFSGTAFGSKRDQSYVGDKVNQLKKPISDFSEDQYGASLGGRIIRDRLFFFVSGETTRRKQPTGVSADGSTVTQFFKPADAAHFRDLLIQRYDYDPGTLGDFSGKTDSDLLLAKLDYNISTSNQATLRHNYVDASRDAIADRNSNAFRFPTAIYSIADKTNSTVLQLTSVLGANSFNLGRIGYQTIRDVRVTPVIFPTVDIGPISRRPELTAGTERFSGANALDQDILEVTDDFTLMAGNHTITLGTSNQFFDFKNLFLSDAYGFYRFNSVADFEAGKVAEYSITFANGIDPRRPTSFGAEQYGLYAGDLWRVNDDLTFILGLRADYPRLSDKPSRNQSVYDTFGIDTSNVPTNTLTVSPRAGFNWNLGGAKTRQQVRGGIGVFAGRTPYVWISNAYGNTGVETTSLSWRRGTGDPLPFNPDPYAQPRNLPPGSGAVSVDAIDPDFEFPRVLRATLGYDRELPFGIRGTVEAMYTQTQQDIFYLNRNKVATGTAFDGRPTYSNVNSGFRDIPYLTNTSKGEQTNLSVQLDKRFDSGFSFNASYAYMDAKSAFDGTSSRAISNWQFMPTRGDIYKQELSRSTFEIRDRFNFLVSQQFATGKFDHNLALFYTVQSGAPYSVLISGDPNKDGYSTNDLLYIPTNTSDIIIQGATAEEFDNFLSWTGLAKYRGQVIKRNSSQAPWTRSLDFHYDLGLPINVVRAQVTFDILNLINLIDSDKGTVQYVPFQSFTPLRYAGIDAATGKPIYRTAFSHSLDSGRAFSTNNLRSRWQMKLGLRVSF